MKKILFLFALLFVVSSNVQSQKFTQKIEPKIVSDKIDADGFRSYKTTTHTLDSSKVEILFISS